MAFSHEGGFRWLRICLGEEVVSYGHTFGLFLAFCITLWSVCLRYQKETENGVYAVQFSEENNCIVATEKLSRINSFLFFTGGHNCILPVKSFILLFLTCSRKTKMLKIKYCVIIISHVINFVSLHLLIPAWLAKFPKLVI
jgi:hypothetical protein